MTVRRNAELPLLYNGGKPENEIRQRSEAILQAVGLGDRMEHRPTELSGGQQQRVAIARGADQRACPDLSRRANRKPRFPHRGGNYELAAGLNKEHGLTLVIVTHDPNIASRTQTGDPAARWVD